MAGAVVLDRTTVSDLVELREVVFLVHRLDPYERTPSAWMNRTPRIHTVHRGLAAHLWAPLAAG